MKKYFAYPFYRSLRFRFGALFGLLFLAFLLVLIFFLYHNVKNDLEKSFTNILEGRASLVLQKTEVSPVVLPVPQNDERFLLSYNNTLKIDTLYDNLSSALFHLRQEVSAWRVTKSSKTLETGGVVTIVYALPADDLNRSVTQLQFILFIYVPVAFIISLAAGYFLSGFLLKPITHIIEKANQTDLQTNIKLLNEPATKDELHQLTVSLNRMLERIQRQSQQQNAFFASASHELRTPLSNMLTELQVIQITDIPVNMQLVFKNQIAEVQRLNKLVNDFLLMSQLRSGTVSLHKEVNNVAETCMDIAKNMQQKALIKQQTFKIVMQPADGKFEIICDGSQLSVIINNLLDNAVKYGQKSSVINIAITQSGKSISLGISNTTENVITDINTLKSDFHRQGFYTEGFGLGLWLVDQLAQTNNAILQLSFKAPVFSAEITFPA